jgi:hypothetical protein
MAQRPVDFCDLDARNNEVAHTVCDTPVHALVARERHSQAPRTRRLVVCASLLLQSSHARRAGMRACVYVGAARACTQKPPQGVMFKPYAICTHGRQKSTAGLSGEPSNIACTLAAARFFSATDLISRRRGVFVLVSVLNVHGLVAETGRNTTPFGKQQRSHELPTTTSHAGCVSASPARCGVASYCFNEMHSRMAMQLRADSTHRRQAVCLQA